MTATSEQEPGCADPADRLATATGWFMRLRADDAVAEDLVSFQRWLEEDPANARAYAKVSESWSTVGDYAAAPEVMLGRRDALEDARQAARGRWQPGKPRWLKYALAAAGVGVAVAAGIILWIQTQAGVYSTGVGERRALTLADGSVVTLDARSRIRVKYRETERLIALEQGQARFDVARDVVRPFRVKAGSETVVALGTQFNVELVARSVLVTMIEGRVAVLPDQPAHDFEPQIDLTAGEALHVRQDGKAIRLPRVDVERVTAWQNGKMFFDNEPLASAAERINRYATEQIEVDPSAAQVGISGVFNAGDARAFVEAVTAYFPVKAEEAHGKAIRLVSRQGGTGTDAP
jgi:transmembrane sensor